MEPRHMLERDNPSQQEQYFGPMLSQCWASVVDGGPTLVQHRANVLCLLGYGLSYIGRQLQYTFRHNLFKLWPGWHGA